MSDSYGYAIHSLLEEVKKLTDRVKKLEKEVSSLKGGGVPIAAPAFPSFPPLPFCKDGGDHDYPKFWGSITPPPCTKCGKPASNWPIVTCKTPPYPHYE